MKKIFGICICLVVLVAALVVPTVAFAAESTASAGVIIHFLNPTSVAISGNHLFVADNIDKDDNKSVILNFTLTANKATYVDTVEVDGNVKNLSNKGNSGLYAILDDQVIEYTVSRTGKLVEAKTFTELGELNGFVDTVYAQSGANKTEYFLAQEGLYRNDAGGWAEKFNGAQSAVAIDNYIYYLRSDADGNASSKRFDGSILAFKQGDVYNNKFGTGNGLAADPIGLFAWNDKVGVFWSDKVSFVEVNTQDCTFAQLLSYNSEEDSEEAATIKDVVAKDGKLFVLNDKNVVEVYDGEVGNMELVYSVGSDTVQEAVPKAFTSFTLARSTGYPSNLVFKTIDEDTSIPELVTDAEEYLILGFDGDKDSLYYYVLTNDNHFGWVKKTNFKLDENGKFSDDKLSIVDTAVSSDPNVDYTTKFASLNAVYLYSLPRSVDDFRSTTFTQTTANSPEVTVLQRFVEKTADSETVWYFVSFEADGKTHTGFVQENDLGKFYPTPKANVPSLGDKKVNSTLFEAVKVYADANMKSVYETEDAPSGVKLYSGRRVTVIAEYANGVSLIQINYGDGSKIYGYVASDRLIGIHSITTNAIVGLSLLAAAIALTTTLVIVFVKRKKGTAPRRKRQHKSGE